MAAVDADRLKRHDLTDDEWARLEPLLPWHPRQGHRWNDHRVGRIAMIMWLGQPVRHAPNPHP
jgi:transposase